MFNGNLGFLKGKSMKKMGISFVLILLSSLSWSDEYSGGHTIKKLYGSSYITFGIDNAPNDKMCNYHGRHLTFDATTDKGRNILSILLAAHLSGKNIDVWYIPSSAPGSDSGSGCAHATLAEVTQVGFSD